MTPVVYGFFSIAAVLFVLFWLSFVLVLALEFWPLTLGLIALLLLRRRARAC